MNKLLNFVWVFQSAKNSYNIGVNAYTLTEARTYLKNRIEYDCLEECLLSNELELLEPVIYDDTEGMKPGWK